MSAFVLKKIVWVRPNGMGSTLRTLIIVEAGFFPHCLSLSSQKQWFSECGPATSRSASSGYLAGTHISGTYWLRNFGDRVGDLFLNKSLRWCDAHSSLRTISLKWTSLLGSVPVSSFWAGTNIDLNIMRQVLSPPPNTKFCSVLAWAAVHSRVSCRITQAIMGHYGGFVYFIFSLCCSLPTNVEILLRTGQLPRFWTSLLVFLITLLGMPVPIHPVSSPIGGWMGLILLISDSVVAPL